MPAATRGELRTVSPGTMSPAGRPRVTAMNHHDASTLARDVAARPLRRACPQRTLRDDGYSERAHPHAMRASDTGPVRARMQQQVVMYPPGRLTPRFSCEGFNKKRAERAINSAFVGCNQR